MLLQTKPSKPSTVNGRNAAKHSDRGKTPWTPSANIIRRMQKRVDRMMEDDFLSAASLYGQEVWLSLNIRDRRQAGRVLAKLVVEGEIEGLTFAEKCGALIYYRLK